MKFEKGNTYGHKSKRGEGKIGKEIKEYIESLSNNLIRSIDTENLTDFEKIQYIKLLLPYVLPKKKEIDINNEWQEQPLFDVQVIDSTETKERLDRFEDYAKDKDIKLEDFS